MSRVTNFFKYPKTVNRRVLKVNVTFKVYNLIEEDRVLGSNSEMEFTEEIISELKPTDNYFDIGSCIGFTAISAAINSECKVFAFEPDNELAEHLRHNIELNRASDKIQVNQWAVSDTDGTIDFFTSGANGASPSLAKTQNQSRKVTVKTYRIDSAIKQNILKIPSVIKLDIEGAELLALKGMAESLNSAKSPRVIFIESHPPF
ncbi:MAG TPA: FkbM family methyltransferase, partial [Flavitalea sp.]|nr:FkbM family methyltransferase [Flavitalea sp.]